MLQSGRCRLHRHPRKIKLTKPLRQQASLEDEGEIRAQPGAVINTAVRSPRAGLVEAAAMRIPKAFCLVVPFDGLLTLIWERSSFEEDSVRLFPTDVRFSSRGLLVFDAGSRQVRVFDSSTGAFLSTLGREGQGPGELSASFWFQGA